ncbi:MAG TPA: esterase-like activity of phytase family protein [Hyphomicrobiaceae bacterium]|nr:esterase-like activity of phytase family protein [Hyphomicrobiaceae bacterium]
MTDFARSSRLSRRRVVAALIAASAAGPAMPKQAFAEDDDKGRVPSKAEAIAITARPVAHFERGRPDAKRFGDLEFRGGLVLTSPSPDFGGWSDLIVEADGSRLFAVSDVGAWLSADIKYDGTRPAGLTNARIGPMLTVKGRPLEDKREGDAESLALVDGNLTHGTVVIGFERLHRLGRFEIRDRELQAPSGYMKMPPDSRRMSANQGLEGVAVLRAGPLKGSIVGFAERLTRGSGYHSGWIWSGGEPKGFQLRDIDGFDITGAAGLDDGGLLVLERRFRWTEGVKMRIRHLAAADIKPGARLDGRSLIQADGSFEIDNMEGIAVHRGRAGETIVTLMSDDNFNSLLQRNLLLQFTLLSNKAANASRP